jgi:hypothetical protein
MELDAAVFAGVPSVPPDVPHVNVRALPCGSVALACRVTVEPSVTELADWNVVPMTGAPIGLAPEPV